MYWTYFKYIVEHKWNVGIECFKAGLFFHAFTHDISKFLPSEFIPYARFFHSKNRTKEYKTSDENDENFQLGWNRHQKRNKHHWNFWVLETKPIKMPIVYMFEMMLDWKAITYIFGDSISNYWNRNRDKMILHAKTIAFVEKYKEVL